MMNVTMRWLGAVALAPLLACPAFSEAGDTPERDERDILQVFSADTACVHWADGQDWTSEFVFVNLSAQPQSGKLEFRNSEGRPQEVDIRGIGRRSSFDIRLNGYGSLRLETRGTSSSLTQGTAELVLPDLQASLDNKIGASVIFRRKLPGGPTYEASVPFGPLFTKKGYLPFDHRGGHVSGVAIANLSPGVDRVLLLQLFEEDGTPMGSYNLYMPSGSHRAFSLAGEFPEVNGKAGMLVVSVQRGGGILGIGLLGLRFNPDGSFTTITPMISVDEAIGI